MGCRVPALGDRAARGKIYLYNLTPKNTPIFIAKRLSIRNGVISKIIEFSEIIEISEVSKISENSELGQIASELYPINRTIIILYLRIKI